MPSPLKLADLVNSIITKRMRPSKEGVRKLVSREAGLPTHEEAYADIEKAMNRAGVPENVRFKHGDPELPPMNERIFDFEDVGSFPHAYLEEFDQPITKRGVSPIVKPAIRAATLRRIVEDAKEGVKRGKAAWYDLSPLHRFAAEELPPEDLQYAQQFMKLGVPMSHQTPVPAEVLSSAYINRLAREQGPEAIGNEESYNFTRFGGGAPTQRLDNARALLLGQPAPATQSKLNAYAQNRAGNLFPATMDSKILDKLGVGDDIHAPQKGAAGAVLKSMGARMGIEPARLQSSIWDEGKGNAYTRGAEEPIAATINNLLYRAAMKLGEDPKRFAVDVLSGKRDIPFRPKELGYRRGGPVKMAVGGPLKAYIKSLLPDKFKELSLEAIRGGSGRQAFKLGDDRIAKIARLPLAPTKGETWRGLYENSLMDDQNLHQHGLLPRLDYMDPLGELYVSEGLNRPMPRPWTNKLEKIYYDAMNEHRGTSGMMNDVAEFDPRLAPFMDYEVLKGDFMAPRHWMSRPKIGGGQLEESPVLIDEGALSDKLFGYDAPHGQYGSKLWDTSDIKDRRADFLRMLKQDNRNRVLKGIKERALQPDEPQIGFDFEKHGGPVHMGKGGLATVLKMLKGNDSILRKPSIERLERLREEVPASDYLYKPQALHDALMNPRSRLAAMKPAEFERASWPLEQTKAVERGSPVPTSDLNPFEIDRIRALKKLIESGQPFDDIPELFLKKHPDIKLPAIDAHEGRHRSRAIAMMPDIDKALVHLHGFGPPAYLSGLHKSNNFLSEWRRRAKFLEGKMQPGGEFVPESFNTVGKGPERASYDDVFIGKPWKQGGAVHNPSINAALGKARKLMAAGGPAKAIRNFLRGVEGSQFDEQMEKLKSRVNNSLDEQDVADPSKGKAHSMKQWIDRNLANYLMRQHGTADDPLKQMMIGTNDPNATFSLLTKRPAAEWYESLYTGTTGGGASAPVGHKNLVGDEPPPWFMKLVDQDWPRHWSKKQFDAARIGESGINPRMPAYKVGNEAIKALTNPPREITEKYQRRHAPPVDLYDLDPQLFPRHLGHEMNDVLDYLRTLPPESLNRVSVPQAVKSSREWHAEMAKKAEKAAMSALENVPVHKAYPDGWKWAKLKHIDPNESPALKGKREIDADVEQTIKQAHDANRNTDKVAQSIGKQLGHCYQNPETCADYLDNSTLYSLIDPKGKARATVEARPTHKMRKPEGQAGPWQFDEAGEDIAQIRGPQYPPHDMKVEDDARRYVADFIRSGKFGDIQELENAGIKKVYAKQNPFNPHSPAEEGKQRLIYALPEEVAPFERYEWSGLKKKKIDPPEMLTKEKWMERARAEGVDFEPSPRTRSYIIPDDWEPPAYAAGGAVNVLDLLEDDDDESEEAGLEYLLGGE